MRCEPIPTLTSHLKWSWSLSCRNFHSSWGKLETGQEGLWNFFDMPLQKKNRESNKRNSEHFFSWSIRIDLTFEWHTLFEGMIGWFFPFSFASCEFHVISLLNVGLKMVCHWYIQRGKTPVIVKGILVYSNGMEFDGRKVGLTYICWKRGCMLPHNKMH